MVSTGVSPPPRPPPPFWKRVSSDYEGYPSQCDDRPRRFNSGREFPNDEGLSQTNMQAEWNENETDSIKKSLLFDDSYRIHNRNLIRPIESSDENENVPKNISILTPSLKSSNNPTATLTTSKRLTNCRMEEKTSENYLQMPEHLKNCEYSNKNYMENRRPIENGSIVIETLIKDQKKLHRSRLREMKKFNRNSSIRSLRSSLRCSSDAHSSRQQFNRRSLRYPLNDGNDSNTIRTRLMEFNSRINEANSKNKSFQYSSSTSTFSSSSSLSSEMSFENDLMNVNQKLSINTEEMKNERIDGLNKNQSIIDPSFDRQLMADIQMKEIRCRNLKSGTNLKLSKFLSQKPNSYVHFLLNNSTDNERRKETSIIENTKFPCWQPEESVSYDNIDLLSSKIDIEIRNCCNLNEEVNRSPFQLSTSFINQPLRRSTAITTTTTTTTTGENYFNIEEEQRRKRRFRCIGYSSILLKELLQILAKEYSLTLKEYLRKLKNFQDNETESKIRIEKLFLNLNLYEMKLDNCLWNVNEQRSHPNWYEDIYVKKSPYLHRYTFLTERNQVSNLNKQNDISRQSSTNSKSSTTSKSSISSKGSNQNRRISQSNQLNGYNRSRNRIIQTKNKQAGEILLEIQIKFFPKNFQKKLDKKEENNVITTGNSGNFHDSKNERKNLNKKEKKNGIDENELINNRINEKFYRYPISPVNVIVPTTTFSNLAFCSPINMPDVPPSTTTIPITSPISPMHRVHASRDVTLSPKRLVTSPIICRSNLTDVEMEKKIGRRSKRICTLRSSLQQHNSSLVKEQKYCYSEQTSCDLKNINKLKSEQSVQELLCRWSVKEKARLDGSTLQSPTHISNDFREIDLDDVVQRRVGGNECDERRISHRHRSANQMRRCIDYMSLMREQSRGINNKNKNNNNNNNFDNEIPSPISIKSENGYKIRNDVEENEKRICLEMNYFLATTSHEEFISSFRSAVFSPSLPILLLPSELFFNFCLHESDKSNDLIRLIMDEKVQKILKEIRSNPLTFVYFQYNMNLVDIVNRIANKSARLPFGWEEQFDQNGISFFINHLNRTTSYLDPRLTKIGELTTINYKTIINIYRVVVDVKLYYHRHLHSSTTEIERRTENKLKKHFSQLHVLMKEIHLSKVTSNNTFHETISRHLQKQYSLPERWRRKKRLKFKRNLSFQILRKSYYSEEKHMFRDSRKVRSLSMTNLSLKFSYTDIFTKLLKNHQKKDPLKHELSYSDIRVRKRYSYDSSSNPMTILITQNTTIMNCENKNNNLNVNSEAERNDDDVTQNQPLVTGSNNIDSSNYNSRANRIVRYMTDPRDRHERDLRLIRSVVECDITEINEQSSISTEDADRLAHLRREHARLTREINELPSRRQVVESSFGTSVSERSRTSLNRRQENIVRYFRQPNILHQMRILVPHVMGNPWLKNTLPENVPFKSTILAPKRRQTAIRIWKKIKHIRMAGLLALQRYVNDVELNILISLLEEEIVAYSLSGNNPITNEENLQITNSTQTNNNSEHISDYSDTSAQDPSNMVIAHVYYFATKIINKREQTPFPKLSLDRIRTFRRKLDKNYSFNPNNKVQVSRATVVEQAFKFIMQCSRRTLIKQRLYIDFTDEIGLDYGGPGKEFFSLIAKEIFNPKFGLFDYQLMGEDFSLTLKQNAQVESSTKISTWYKFCGRFLALTITHQYQIPVVFCKFFLKSLLRSNGWSLEDLKDVDEVHYNSVKWLQETDLSVPISEEDKEKIQKKFCFKYFGKYETLSDSLQLTFSVYDVVDGERREVNLLPNGSKILVTEKNKKSYMNKLVSWRLHRNTERNLKYIQEGFYEIIDAKLIRTYIEPDDLHLIISGKQEVDVEDWKKYTEYKGGYHDKHMTIIMFWKIVQHRFNDSQRLQLLEFATGTSTIPLEGFRGLRNQTGLRPFCIESYGSIKELPTSHTCFNRLSMPMYTDESLMYEKLTYAIEEGLTFSVQ